MIDRNVFRSLNIFASFRELSSDGTRKQVILSLAFTQLLVQLSTLPLALSVPSMAEAFDVDVSQAAWTVIARLLVLGSTVFFFARLGSRIGHVRLYFLGAGIMAAASAMAATSGNIYQAVIWSGFVGVGASMITANSNPILAMVFTDTERGRAYSIPIIAARLGTLLGMALFGVFLQFFTWRLVFLTSVPVGLMALYMARPLLTYEFLKPSPEAKKVIVGVPSALLMTAALSVFILSGLHVHSGEESFVSAEALGYHLPAHGLFLVLAGVFIFVQRRSLQPYLDFGHFRKRQFSMALFSDHTFHMSMMAVVTLVPILVENGLGYDPIVASWVLIPGQGLGIFLPLIAGYYFDKSNPPWLRPAGLLSIASGFVLLALFASQVPIWVLPILLIPAFIGTHTFNAPSNATIMNSLPEDRSFASGAMETSRQMGHTIGATIAATMLGLALPASISFMTAGEAEPFYRTGFQYAATAVIFTIMCGAIVAAIQGGLISRRSATKVPVPANR
ncbi:MAG: MFS transporter [Chloroflexi bacterium]|nr:MFS transporter [Chloroflexota bacterium]